MDETAIRELIADDKFAEFGKLFLAEFLKNGFGTATKRHTELHVFHLLERLGSLSKLDNNTASEALQITESKVKNYRYESKLRFAAISDDEFKQHVLWMLAKSDFDTDSLRIKLVVEDTLMRKRLSATSKRVGGVPDTSFNSEIVSLPHDQLAFLIEWIFDKDTAEDYRKQFKKLLAKGSKVGYAEIQKAFVLGVAKGFGGGLVTALKKWFAGGMT
ncbi:hypothetical protein KQH82_06210 [bacterium]|nr:hypothetical protein [bacterium]